MNKVLPELLSKPIFYRVNTEGVITERDSWEKLIILPDGLFYLERYVISFENYNGNWHINYGYNILNKDRMVACPLIENYFLLEIKSFLNTSSSPLITSDVSCYFEKKDGKSLLLYSSKSHLFGGLKNIFYELNLVNDSYKGSLMEYVIAEGNSGIIRISNPDWIFRPN